MVLLAPLGLALIVLVLLDGFEAMILTRRISQTVRFTRLYIRGGWVIWARLARLMSTPKRRAMHLGVFGPLSLISLFGVWAFGLILGFGLFHTGVHTTLNPSGEAASLGVYLYLSGVTFFTLGFGDLTPAFALGRAAAVAEAGVGFAFLAIVISYLPVLYGAFSKREATISLLDARGGSPPSASQVLTRLSGDSDREPLSRMMEEWERWSAELLESHISYPILAYYRSQHDNQSWLAAMTAILDTSALALAVLPAASTYQARLTFAMTRHAAVDLAQVFALRPKPGEPDRLPASSWNELRARLAAAGWSLGEQEESGRRLRELRGLYEPFVIAMGRYFALPIPPILGPDSAVDNWQTSAWMRKATGLGPLAGIDPRDDHKDE